MKYCCTGFLNLLSCVGQRGHAAVVWADSSGELRFLLQSRGLSFDDKSKLKPAPVDVVINLSAEIGMKYCPFCGRLLEELINEHPKFFRNLSKKHEKYLEVLSKFQN